MAKLYPPYIEGTLPAMIARINNENQITSISMSLPYILNRAVAPNIVKKLFIKIKTINTNQNIALIVKNHSHTSINNTYDFFINDQEIINKLQIGQSYKIQLACGTNDGQEGYYSTVGIAKYTYQPTLNFINIGESIDNYDLYGAGMSLIPVYAHTYTYSVSYSNTDLTEIPYSYHFYIYDKTTDQIIFKSDELLYNIELNTNYHAFEIAYTFLQDLIIDHYYIISCSITTINNATATISLYVKENTTNNNLISGTLNPVMNFDNGYISVHLKSAAALNGTYRLVRTGGSIDGSDTDIWYPLATFNYGDTIENNEIFRDFTVTQGYKYTYGFYQENVDGEGHRSNRIESEPITVDFEDMFLYDGERQLRIKFNPQVSSFKTNILESKAEAIGSKYPFFFRNGRVEYKEFPINGLISYWMNDEEQSGLFLSDSQIGLEDGFDTRLRTKETRSLRSVQLRTTNQSGYNFAAERTFKLSVLDWLNDGKPKLFRSPGEGTYLVRLMGVSLSPEQQLSRLLHSFSCTAYEIGDTSYKTLTNKQNNILRLPEYDISYVLIGQADLSEATNNTNIFANKQVYSFYIDAISPGYSITYSGQNITETTEALASAAKEFKAASGTYYTSLTINNLIDNPRGITITYAYQDIPELEGE